MVPKRIEQMEKAIKSMDFAEFAKITCVDSNQFHATCLDTSPPIFYLNDTSRRQALNVFSSRAVFLSFNCYSMSFLDLFSCISRAGRMVEAFMLVVMQTHRLGREVESPCRRSTGD